MKTEGYLSDSIGTAYKEWKPRDIIFISGSTGSGKSHFILYDLLRYVIKKSKENKVDDKNVKILYLVNRKILKIQIEQELRTKVSSELNKDNLLYQNTIKEYITVRTYQSIEEELKQSGTSVVENEKYEYVVYDECHYFYSDSDYNTYTQMSYDWLRVIFDNSIQIFMSATMGSVSSVIRNRLPEKLYCVPGNSVSLTKILKESAKGIQKQYIKERDNTNIQINLFKDDDELVSDIINKNDAGSNKWLIFVDSIERGRKLQGALLDKRANTTKNELKSEDIVFIDADYPKNDDASESVSQLTKEKIIKKQIIIATSVMDNGVSIHDLNLKNMVIMADTEEEFIQMLGRKRMEGESVCLYICVRNKSYFKNRLYLAEKILATYEKYGEDIRSMYIREWHNSEKVEVEPIFLPVLKSDKKFDALLPFLQIGDEIIKSKGEPIDRWFNIYNSWRQQRVLEKVFKSEQDYRSIRKFVYVLNGRIAINNFAILKCRNLIGFYRGMIEAMEDDEYAFVRKQMEWLGLAKGTVEETLQYCTLTLEEKYAKELEEGICEQTEGASGELAKGIIKRMSKTECAQFRVKYRKQILFFFENNEELTDTKKKHITRTDNNALKEEYFNKCMEYANLPYEMVVEKGHGDAVYLIKQRVN